MSAEQVMLPERRLALARLLSATALGSAGLAAMTEEARAATILLENALFNTTQSGVTNKLSDGTRWAQIYYNVVEYGADPNGSLDSTAAINLAISSASYKGTIYFPPGSYKVSAPLSLPSTSQLVFKGPSHGAANLFGTFNGFIFDNYTTSTSASITIENLGIQNGFCGNCFDATLSTASVTTPVASPGLVNWTGHNFAAGSPVSFSVSAGSLPTGITAGTVYYVIAAGLTANSFQISATPGGSAINFTGTSSGTQTGTSAWVQSGSPVDIVLTGANPGVAAGGALWVPNSGGLSTNSVFIGMITSVANWPRVTVLSTAVAYQGPPTTGRVSAVKVIQCYAAATAFISGGSGTVVTTPIASPGVVNWTGSNFVAGAGVSFTGAGLPTGIVAGTTYYVLSTGLTANSFQIAATPGGTAINFTGSSTGTQNGFVTLAKIKMSVSRPAGIGTGLYYVYDYEQYLADPKYDYPLGVASWDSATTVTFTLSSGPLVQGSVGSSDRLWFAPVAGAIRLSSSLQNEVRNCGISGFFGVMTNQDKIDDTTPASQSLSAQGWHLVVETCNFGNPGGVTGLLGNHAIYLTNNSLSINNSIQGFWCGERLTGTACGAIGGRSEVNYFGVILGGDFTSINNTLTVGYVANRSMESNLLGLYCKNASAVLESTGASCNALFQVIGGFYFNVFNGVINNVTLSGHFGTGYGLYIADVSQRTLISINGTTSFHLDTPSQSWRLPAQAYWGTCTSCDNPALVYTCANLPGFGGSPIAAVEGEEYNVSDGTDSLAWGAALTNTGSHATHYKVRHNGTTWTVMGK